MRLRAALLSLPSLALLQGACDRGPVDEVATLAVVSQAPVDRPLDAATHDERQSFRRGDRLFDLPMRESDGLGPLYIRASCASCHADGGRGPGTVEKVAYVEPDGVTPATVQPPFGHTLRPYVTAGATTPLLADPLARATSRLSPAIHGRGYLEAVADDEILRVEAEQSRRTDGISGRANRVTYGSVTTADPAFHAHVAGDENLIGRFGLKARAATLDDFVADAFVGDMGMTSPLRPAEPGNPDGLTDDRRPGVDLPAEVVRDVAAYVRLADIPPRGTADAEGGALFESVGCAVCHAPALRTRTDYPVRALAGIEAPVYTDLLLHDLGDENADGIEEEGASSREWRTAPLIGLAHLRSYWHDGSALDVDEAIEAHDGKGSEAHGVVQAWRALPPAGRAALSRFVESL